MLVGKKVMEFITVEELNEKFENKEEFILLDVRDQFEANISNFNIETSSIPYADLSEKVSSLDKDQEYVVFCRSGATSKDATALLLKEGFENVKSLKGGINEWAKKIDSSLPQY